MTIASALTGTTDVTVRVRAPERATVEQHVTLHLGPTNSGKTHTSLAELAERRRGIYVAPLRMLAQEVFERLTELCGEERVGLLTGDQVIRPGAPVLCCTAEMAPLDAPFAVIDEAHWLDDPSRGKSWTRLLIEGRYPRLSIIAAAETATFLHRLYPRAEIVHHRRLGDLWDGGATRLDELWPGTVVVAFSRPAVLALAREIRTTTGLRSGVLYGTLPSALRREQVNRFEQGDLDVLVATDSIGHGINLPTTNIVFAETEKYDGTRRRSLRPWEAAQIAGRAGRGADRPGLVQTLAGVPGFRADPRVVSEAICVALGAVPSDLAVDAAPVGPTFDDLSTGDPSRLSERLRLWHATAGSVLTDHPWASPAELVDTARRLRILEELWGGVWPLDAASTWNLANAPVASDRAFELVAIALFDPTFDVGVAVGAAAIDEADLVAAERIASVTRDLTSLANRLGALNGVDADTLGEMTRRAEKRIASVLDETISSNTYGRCSECGTPTTPRFTRCGPCNRERRRGGATLRQPARARAL